MKRTLPIWLISLAVLSLGIMACSLIGGQPPATTPDSSGATAAGDQGTIIAVTSSIPTATPGSGGAALPTGALILTQLGRPLAQLPNAAGQTVSLPAEHFGSRASPDGRYGVKLNDDHTLSLVDYSGSGSAQAVPQSSGLTAPGVTWKADSSGFAFYDVPTAAPAGGGAISYYDVASKQTRQLIPPPAQSGMVASSIAFSPDSKYLIYAVGSATAEGIGGPGSKLFALDTAANQSFPLPAKVYGFTHWLRDSQSFIVRGIDDTGGSQFTVYNLSSLNAPKVLTPSPVSDFLVDVSPDGKFLVVSSAPKGRGQVANISIMNLDGSNRKALTKFTTPDQAITGLFWSNDGIYYSLRGTDNQDTTWRMDLNGANPTQVAQGTLNGIVGIH